MPVITLVLLTLQIGTRQCALYKNGKGGRTVNSTLSTWHFELWTVVIVAKWNLIPKYQAWWKLDCKYPSAFSTVSSTVRRFVCFNFKICKKNVVFWQNRNKNKHQRHHSLLESLWVMRFYLFLFCNHINYHYNLPNLI